MYALVDCSLNDYVTEDLPRPLDFDEEGQDQCISQNEWDRKDRRAGAKIGIRCSPEMQQTLGLMDGKTAFGKWEVLQAKLLEAAPPRGMKNRLLC